MKKIAIFYHCLFYIAHDKCFMVPPVFLGSAPIIIREQMNELVRSGLLDAASEFHVGINGGTESFQWAKTLIPSKAVIQYHGLGCRNENRTLLMIEEWLKQHRHDIADWVIFYFHSKGASRPNPLTDPLNMPWRKCMMRNLVTNWKKCLKDLEDHDAVGSHWMQPPATPAGQHIFAGTFWAAKANYLATLPSIMERSRIKLSGIDAFESRFEAEVWIGNGPRIPKVKDYHGPSWNPLHYSCKP